MFWVYAASPLPKIEISNTVAALTVRITSPLDSDHESSSHTKPNETESVLSNPMSPRSSSVCISLPKVVFGNET